MSEDRFNEKEVAEILRAAATAQSAGPTGSGESGDFSAEEIASLAAEVGIDPKYVLKAAEKVAETRSAPKRTLFFSAPIIDLVEKTYDGILSDDDWQDIVNDLRTQTGSEGTMSIVGGLREWKGGTDTVSASLSARVADGKTKIRFTVNRNAGLQMGWAFGLAITFALVFVLCLKEGKAGMNPLLMILTATLAAAWTLFLTRTSISAWAKTNRQGLAAFRTRLEGLAAPPQNAPTIRVEPSETLQQRLSEGA